MRILLTYLAGILSIGNAYAQNPLAKYCNAITPTGGFGFGVPSLCASSQAEAEALVGAFAVGIANMLLTVIGTACVLAVIWGGMMIITKGDTGKEEGKKIVFAAVLGLILAVTAEAFVLFIAHAVRSVSP